MKEQSRNEEILRSIIDGTEYTEEPQSRIEKLLLELKMMIQAGGASQDDIYAALKTYLDSHPEYIGASAEQVQTLEELVVAVGDLDDLTMEDKSNLVSAINDIASKQSALNKELNEIKDVIDGLIDGNEVEF